MKIRVMGSTLFVSTEVAIEDLKKLQAKKPEALRLVEECDGEKVEKFRVQVSDKPCLCKFGAAFTANTNTDPKVAVLAVDIGDKPESKDVKEYVAEKYGAAILALEKIESQFEPALADYESEQAALASMIEVAL